MLLLFPDMHGRILGMSERLQPSIHGSLHGGPRSSTAWTKANGFLSSRPVIPNVPGPGVSIPHELQHRVTFGIPRHGGPSRTVPALCSETERFAMSVAHPFETERFANLPSRNHYYSVSGGVAGLGAELTACVLADKGAESGCARAAGEGSVHITSSGTSGIASCANP